MEKNTGSIEVSDGLERDEYETVCKIGADIFGEIMRRLVDAGLSRNHVGNVLAVACGGMSHLGVDAHTFGMNVGKAMDMWQYEPDADKMNLGLEFKMIKAHEGRLMD